MSSSKVLRNPMMGRVGFVAVAQLLLSSTPSSIAFTPLRPITTNAIKAAFPPQKLSRGVVAAPSPFSLEKISSSPSFHSSSSLLTSSAVSIGGEKTDLKNVMDATMSVSRQIYSFSILRKYVRKDVVKNPDKWIDGPSILTEDVLDENILVAFVEKNRDLIEQDSDLSDLLLLTEDMKKSAANDADMGLPGDNVIRCFDAEKQNKELVYGIGVNRTRKRITVAFRGTNSFNDVLVDLDFRKYTVRDGENTYEVHNGFRNYLKGETVDDEEYDDRLVSKFRIITDELKEILMDDKEGYEIFVTGHSLGGALAIYYGLKLSETDNDLFPMVNVVSYASPYVGTESFRNVFRQAELNGKIRHIRVSNQGDCIPANPCIGGFQHVGVNVRLCTDEEPKIVYEGVEKPNLPITFVTFLPTALTVIIKFLSLFIGFLEVIPTLPLIPSLIWTYFTVQILLNSHGLDQYRQGLENGVRGDFLDKTLDVVYEDRLKAIEREGF